MNGIKLIKENNKTFNLIKSVSDRGTVRILFLLKNNKLNFFNKRKIQNCIIDNMIDVKLENSNSLSISDYKYIYNYLKKFILDIEKSINKKGLYLIQFYRVNDNIIGHQNITITRIADDEEELISNIDSPNKYTCIKFTYNESIPEESYSEDFYACNESYYISIDTLSLKKRIFESGENIN